MSRTLTPRCGRRVVELTASAEVVLARLGYPDPGVTVALQRQWPFYVWDEATGKVRWMCSWDTTPEEIDAFAAAVAAAVMPGLHADTHALVAPRRR